MPGPGSGFLPLRLDEDYRPAMPANAHGSGEGYGKTAVTLCAVVGFVIIGAVEHERINAALEAFLLWCRALGWFAPFFVMMITAVMNVFMLPTFPLMVGVGVLFPKMYGMVLGEFVGVMSVFSGLWLGSLAAFQLGRTLFQDWARTESLKHDWMTVVNAMIEEQGWWVVFLARMTPVLPAEMFNYACSLTSLSLGAYGVGCLGSVVPVGFWVCSTASAAAVAGHGHESAEARRERREFDAALIGINIIVLAALTVILYSAFRKYKEKAEHAAENEVDRRAREEGLDMDDAGRAAAVSTLQRSTSFCGRSASFNNREAYTSLSPSLRVDA